MTLGTCGGAVVPGLGLIVVGVDQIAAGINNVQNPGSPSMSVLEYGGYSLAKGLGASENTAQTVGAFTPAALSAIFNIWGSLTACFAAGTPLLTPDGQKPIEHFRPGDWVLSAPECDPEAPPEPRQVEEVFTNFLPLLHVQVGGKTIRTTSEHPFYVRGKGWAAAKELTTGDLLRSHDGQWMAVQSVAEGEKLAPVYNLRVAEHHTYFVGSHEWGFSIWAHNACNLAAAQNAANRYGAVDLGNGWFRYPSRRLAQQAASEIADDLGPAARAIRASEFRGGPYWMRNSRRVIGRQSADGLLGWRNDFLGHPQPRHGASFQRVGTGRSQFPLVLLKVGCDYT